MMDDETRAFLRHLFDEQDPVPRDIVPGTGPDRETLLRQNEMVGTWNEVTTPGDVLLDPEGVPIGVGPPTTERVFFGGLVITAAELARVGLTPAHVPNLTVTDRPKRKDDNDE